MSNSTKLSLTQAEALAEAISKYLPNYTFLLAGQTYTTAQVMTIVNSVVNAKTTVADAVAAVKDARLADKNVEAQSATLIRELRDFVAVAFSNAPSTLEQFGVTPKKVRTPLTASARAAAEAKARATRTARGTKGKQQKAAIRGNVAGVTITPIVLSSSAAAGATAAGTATGTTSTTTATPAGSAGSGTLTGSSVPAVAAGAAGRG